MLIVLELTVEHAASVLIRDLHGGCFSVLLSCRLKNTISYLYIILTLDLAHRQEISPVFRVPSILHRYPSQIILF